MIYLASPYSDPDPLIMKTRFLLAEQTTAHLINRGLWAYSPIVHCHEMAAKYSFPTDFAFWKTYNFDMLRRADSFMLLTLPSWRASKGCNAEIFFAHDAGMKMEMINDDGVIVPWQE